MLPLSCLRKTIEKYHSRSRLSFVNSFAMKDNNDYFYTVKGALSVR